MIILHEYYGHAKNAYHSKKVKSTNFLNSNENFSFSNEDIKKESKIKRYNLSFLGGESGRALEFFISSDKNIIYALKFSYISLGELLNAKLWISSDFSELNKIVNEKIKVNNFILDKEKLNHALPGFPEEKNIIEKVDINEKVIYSSDEHYDSDDFRLAEIKIIKSKNYSRDFKAC